MLFYTLLVTFLLMFLATLALGIGYLITGKTRLKRGCGKVPDETQCSLCDTSHRCEK